MTKDCKLYSILYIIYIILPIFKGNVQRKLRWVHNDVNRNEGPQTVALGILMSFYLDFILVLPYFHLQSVQSKLLVSSGKKSKEVRATSANSIIGAT